MNNYKRIPHLMNSRLCTILQNKLERTGIIRLLIHALPTSELCSVKLYARMKNWNWVGCKQSWLIGKQFLEFSLQWLRKINTFKVTNIPAQNMSHVPLDSKSVVLLLIWSPLHQTSTVEEKSEQSLHIWTILPHCFSVLQMILTSTVKTAALFQHHTHRPYVSSHTIISLLLKVCANVRLGSLFVQPWEVMV